MTRKDINILTTINDMFFTPDYVFSYEKNRFNIAAGFTAYDSNPEPILDPTYGSLHLNHYRWGQPEDEANGRHRLPQHACTREELGLDEDRTSAMFMPAYEPSYNEINFYSKKLQCVESENLSIHGDYNSYKAQMLNVQLVRCHDRNDCKTDAQITEFFKNKFILLIYN